MVSARARKNPDLSYRTAIKRTGPSAPMRRLNRMGLLQGRMLDFGSGRGYDARTFKMDQYDPFYYNVWPHRSYDTITCIYVLNVIPEKKAREKILEEILGLLAPRGIAYIAVRNDARCLRGYTKKGTWQGLIRLGLPRVVTTSSYVIYELEKQAI